MMSAASMDRSPVRTDPYFPKSRSAEPSTMPKHAADESKDVGAEPVMRSVYFPSEYHLAKAEGAVSLSRGDLSISMMHTYLAPS